MRRFCLALDLKSDPQLIDDYIAHHGKVWPEVINSLKESGVEIAEIHQAENRLFMILEVNDGFSFEKKQSIDNQKPEVEEWEVLMWQYQQALPNSRPGEKWRLMKKIFKLKKRT